MAMDKSPNYLQFGRSIVCFWPVGSGAGAESEEGKTQTGKGWGSLPSLPGLYHDLGVVSFGSGSVRDVAVTALARHLEPHETFGEVTCGDLR